MPTRQPAVGTKPVLIAIETATGLLPHRPTTDAPTKIENSHSSAAQQYHDSRVPGSCGSTFRKTRSRATIRSPDSSAISRANRGGQQQHLRTPQCRAFRRHAQSRRCNGQDCRADFVRAGQSTARSPKPPPYSPTTSTANHRTQHRSQTGRQKSKMKLRPSRSAISTN